MPSTPTKASAFASHLHKYAYTPSPPPQKGAVKQRTPVTPADDDLAPATPSKRRRVEAVKKKKDGDGLNDSPLTSSLKPTPTSKAKGQTSPSPSPAKKVVRRYAAPDVYAHLNVVTDHLEEDLRGEGSPEMIVPGQFQSDSRPCRCIYTQSYSVASSEFSSFHAVYDHSVGAHGAMLGIITCADRAASR